MTLWMPNKKKPLYAPMLATFGGGSVRGFKTKPLAASGGDYWSGTVSNWDGNGNSLSSFNQSPSYFDMTANFSQWNSTDATSTGGFKWSPNQDYILFVSYNASRWQSFELNTAGSIGAGAASVTSFDSSGLGSHFDVHVNEDGTKLYAPSYGNGVRYYTMSTGWDLSTISYVSINSSLTGVGGIHISDDGTKLAYSHQVDNKIYSGTLSTPWDITTYSAGTSKSAMVSGETSTYNRSMVVSKDGKTFVWQETNDPVDGTTSESIRWVECSTAWDLSTASSVGRRVVTTDGNGMGFDINGDEMFYGSYTDPKVWVIS